MRNSKGEDEPLCGMRGSQSGSDEDFGEEIEALGIVIAGIHYLARREPIPRSEYLFNYHVT